MIGQDRRRTGWPLGLGGAAVVVAPAVVIAPSPPGASSDTAAAALESPPDWDPFDAVLLRSLPPAHYCGDGGERHRDEEESGDEHAIVRTVVEIVPSCPIEDRVHADGEMMMARAPRRGDTVAMLLHPYLTECLRMVLGRQFSQFPSTGMGMGEGVDGALDDDDEGGGASFATSARMNPGDADCDGDTTETSHEAASKDPGWIPVLIGSGGATEESFEESTVLPFLARRIDVVDVDFERRRRRRRRGRRGGGGEDDVSRRGGAEDGIAEGEATVVEVFVRCCHPHAAADTVSFRDRLEEGLEGRLVVPTGGCLIVVSLPPTPPRPPPVVSDEEEARIDGFVGHDHDGGGVAHVLVEEVLVRRTTKTGGMNDDYDDDDAGCRGDESSKKPRSERSPSRGIVGDDAADVAYRLGRVGTFTVTLLPWDDDDDNDGNKIDLDVVGTDDDQQEHSPAGHRPLPANTPALPCPGYEDLLGRLVELVNLQEASPSPLLLSGPAGVGKTRLASSLLDLLGGGVGRRSPPSSSPVGRPGRPSTHVVSAKDLLLLAASAISYDDDNSHSWSSSSSPLDRHVLPPRLLRQRRMGRRVIVVVDDIDALLDDGGDDDDGSSVGDHERAACLRAMCGMMEVLVGNDLDRDVGDVRNDHDRPTPFILGISRLPLSRLPPSSLARVGRFEREVVVPPPTERQRERILSHWLSRLPIVSGGTGSTTAAINTDRGGNIRGGARSGPSALTGEVFGGEEVAAVTATAALVAERWAAALSPLTAGFVASDLRRVCSDALVAAHATSAASAAAFSSPRIRRDVVRGVTTTEEHRGDGARTAAAPQGQDEGGDGGIPVVGVTWDHVREAVRSCVPSQLTMLDVSRASTFDDYDDALLGDEVGPEFDDSGRRVEAPVSAALRRRRRSRRRHDLSWKSFGGYEETKTRLYRAVVGPWASHISSWGGGDGPSSPSLTSHRKMGIAPPSGVLFHGPSGCGKTFAAECLASSLGLNVVKVRASNVLDQWLGGSEATIRSLFARARAAAPCVLFFDEIDALASNREDDDDGAGEVHSRVLSTLLNEMDGISSDSNSRGVLVVAATNRLDAIDAALLRPGRLDEHVLLSHPTIGDCIEILKVYSRKLPLATDVDLEDLAELLHELRASGADIEGVCRQTCLIALRRTRSVEDVGEIRVTLADFDAAIEQWKR